MLQVLQCAGFEVKQGILVILGHKGSGKSQLARAFAATQPRVVAIDTLGEYGGVIINDPYSLADYLEHAKGLARFQVSYRDKGEHPVPMELVFKMLHALRDCWLVLEEADKWFGPNRSNDAVKWFLKYGRHHRVSVLLVSRRAAEQGPMGTSQADTIVSFRQHELRDLEWIRGVGGDEAARAVENLGQYEWEYVLDTHQEIRQQLDAISGESDNEPAEIENNEKPAEKLEPAVNQENSQEPRKRGRPRKKLDAPPTAPVPSQTSGSPITEVPEGTT